MKSLVKALLVFLLIFCLIGSSVLFLSITTNKDKAVDHTTPIKQTASFVLAEWEFPDEYGQGIEVFDVFENSTGSWQNVGGPTMHDESGVFDWEVGVAIRLDVWTWFNSSLMGAETTNEGKLYQRHNVTVTSIDDTIVFSQQNFTYQYGDPIDPPMFIYMYRVVLDFLPVAGERYTVTVGYEIFW